MTFYSLKDTFFFTGLLFFIFNISLYASDEKQNKPTITSEFDKKYQSNLNAANRYGIRPESVLNLYEKLAFLRQKFCGRQFDFSPFPWSF